MILTNEAFQAVLASLPEPYRTMVVVAQCLGLRVSEITGLQWGDLDSERRQLLVQRSVVNGRVDDVKTEYSHDHVPIHDSLLEVLLAWSEKCPQTEEGWMFPNPLSSKFDRDPEALSSHFRMLRRSVSDMRRGDGRMVRAQPAVNHGVDWLRGTDLNRRPLGYE